ncbi:hypothetical protein Hanom_Chr16g01451821 [Helianthus anomalus]
MEKMAIIYLFPVIQFLYESPQRSSRCTLSQSPWPNQEPRQQSLKTKWLIRQFKNIRVFWLLTKCK